MLICLIQETGSLLFGYHILEKKKNRTLFLGDIDPLQFTTLIG